MLAELHHIFLYGAGRDASLFLGMEGLIILDVGIGAIAIDPTFLVTVSFLLLLHLLVELLLLERSTLRRQLDGHVLLEVRLHYLFWREEGLLAYVEHVAPVILDLGVGRFIVEAVVFNGLYNLLSLFFFALPLPLQALLFLSLFELAGLHICKIDKALPVLGDESQLARALLRSVIEEVAKSYILVAVKLSSILLVDLV